MKHLCTVKHKKVKVVSSETYYNTSGGFGAMASAFVIESLEHMVSWLIVMAAVIFCDLITGLVKSLKIGSKVRFSKACRDTMAKFVTYYAVVVCFAMTQVAAQTDFEIEKWACLCIIIIEAISIAGNILKIKGYSLDFAKVITIFASKKFDIDEEKLDGVIKKDE